MRRPLLLCAALLLAGCHDDHNAPAPVPLVVTTDKTSYSMGGAGSIRIEAEFTNQGSKTIWLGSCGAGTSPLPGTSYVLVVYGTELVSYDANPPSSTDVTTGCTGTGTPYALAPNTGVRMGITVGHSGHFAVATVYASSQGGSYLQRVESLGFTVTP